MEETDGLHSVIRWQCIGNLDFTAIDNQGLGAVER